MNIVTAVCLIIWIYLLTVLHRARLPFFKFLVGSVGLFIFMMIILQPVVTVPLSRLVAAGAGVIGDLTGIFRSYYQYSLIFIESGQSAISMYIDYKCSGVIEIFALTALIWFFPLYSLPERAAVNIIGIIWIYAANILRLLVICLLVHFFGDDIYYFAHAIFGRIIFYGLSVVLYFNIFTKSQIIRQKVGRFSYDSDS